MTIGIRSSNATDNADRPIDSLFPLWTSIERTTGTGDVLGANARVSAYNGLKLLTQDAAYETFEESEKGSLETEKLADRVILDADPLKIAPARIKEIHVLTTISKGKGIYQQLMSGDNRTFGIRDNLLPVIFRAAD